MSLVKFNRETKNNGLSTGFNDIFESLFNDSFFSDRMVSRVPAVNIAETPDHYRIEMAAPGLKKGDFRINLDRNMLTVSAEQENQKEKADKQYTKREYSYHSFVRSFALPDTADDARIDAGYSDGILHIEVAKKEEAKHQVRQIEIK